MNPKAQVSELREKFDMSIIKTGLGIGKTIKNMSRLKEITTVFAKNGLDEFILKLGIPELIPSFVWPKKKNDLLDEEKNTSESKIRSYAYRLRKSFEELGPVFIKFGQLLSTRDDLFSSQFIEEMKKLLDQVEDVSPKEIHSILEKRYGSQWGDIFGDISHAPIAKASIAIVYKARLKEEQADVVLKIRRPHILKLIEQDLSILTFFISKIERFDRNIKFLGLSRLMNDFGLNLRRETDFHLESLNCSKLTTIVKKWDKDSIFYLPKLYKDYCHEDILVLEYLDGIPFSRPTQILQQNAQVGEQLIRGVTVFVHSLLKEGFFHADLHGGNFFLLKNGQIGIIDFGLVGMITSQARINLMMVLYNLVHHRYENLVYDFLDVAEYETIPDIDELTKNIRNELAPFVGLSVKQTNYSQLMKVVFKTLAHHRIFLPREWFTIFRALMTLDGVGKSLSIDFDVYAILEQHVELKKEDLFQKEELTHSALWTLKDLLTLFRFLPRHLKWMLKQFSKNNYALEIRHPGLEREVRSLKNTVTSLSHNLFSSALLLGGVLMAGQNHDGQNFYQIPLTSWIFWILAFVIFLPSYFRDRK
jgi:ubiquinone biosynthesis protein